MIKMMSKEDYTNLENSIKEELNEATREQCVNRLHIAMGFIHNGLILKDLESIWYYYETAQFILECYYAKKSYGLSDHLFSSGYGDDHEWIEEAFIPDNCKKPPYTRHSIWSCKNCSARFRHYYRQEPDIFKTIEEYGIQDKCIRDIKPIR